MTEILLRRGIQELTCGNLSDMQTFCPYPDCYTEYETEAEPPDRFETCPNCHRRGTLRSLEAWRQLAEWKRNASDWAF